MSVSGYEHAIVTVINDKGRRQQVLPYSPTDPIDDGLEPLLVQDVVLAGSKEHRLPPEQIADTLNGRAMKSNKRRRAHVRCCGIPGG